VRQAREEWKAHRQPRMREEAHRLVFLDETGTTTKMTRLRGRARRGARLKAEGHQQPGRWHLVSWPTPLVEPCLHGCRLFVRRARH
jgi:hypothetical protein